MVIFKKADPSATEIAKLLQRSALFGDLENQHRELLVARASIKDFKNGQTIWHLGALPENLYVVASGLIKRSLLPAGGNERVLGLHHAGESVGLPELLAKRAYGALAMAAQPTRLLCLNGESVRQLIRQVPAVAQRVGIMLAQRQLDIESELLSKQGLSTSERVLDYLVQQTSQPMPAMGETLVRLPASKKLIAAVLGITPETLSRSLRELSDAGLLEIRGRLIALKNAPLGLRQPATAVSPEQASLYSVINIAGRQRMLSQRMAKFWMLQGYDNAPSNAKKILQQSVNNFEKQRRLLDNLSLPDELRAIQQQVDRLWGPYRSLLEQPVSAANIAANTATIWALSEEILEATDQAALGFSRITANAGGGLVNLAARQRMLVHRIAKCYLFRDRGVSVDECTAHCRAASADFSAALACLSQEAGDEPQIENQLNRVRKQWLAFQTALEATVPEVPARRAVSVCDLSERLVRQIDSVVFLFEQVAESR